MFKSLKFWLQVAALTAGSACALPALPEPSVIASAVQNALSVAPSAPAAPQTQTGVLAVSRATGRSVVARATAYNSLGSQTDSTPHIRGAPQTPTGPKRRV